MKKMFNELDNRLEQYLDTLVFDAKDSELTPEQAAIRRSKADNDDFEYCKIYFPSIFTEPFNDLHKYISSIKTGIHGVSGARFYGKSAFTFITKYVKPICIGGLGLIGLGMRTQKAAIKRAESLNRLIYRNKKLMYDYNIQFQQERQGDYIINNKQIVTFGKEEGLRGIVDDEFKRFQIVILDDLFNRITVTSEADNEQVYNFVTGEVSGALEDNGCCIWLFNMTSDKSPGKKYSDEHPELCFNLPALNPEGKTNWPGSKYTEEKLEQIKNSLPFDVWMGDWMNQPILLGDIFKLDWLRPVNVNLNDIVATITAVDPSHGQSPAACYKACATLGLTRTGKTILLDIYLRREDYSFVFDYLDNIRRIFPNYKTILWENDFSQFNLAFPYYQHWVAKRGKYLPIVVYNSKDLKTHYYGSDKAGRIMNLVHPFQSGQLLINEEILNTPDYKLWQSQYLSFGKSKEKLDGLDATASAFIMLPRYVHGGSFKSLGSRYHDDGENSWLTER